MRQGLYTTPSQQRRQTIDWITHLSWEYPPRQTVPERTNVLCGILCPCRLLREEDTPRDKGMHLSISHAQALSLDLKCGDGCTTSSEPARRHSPSDLMNSVVTICANVRSANFVGKEAVAGADALLGVLQTRLLRSRSSPDS